MTDIIEAMKDALHLLHDEIVAKEEQIEDLKRQLAERDTEIAKLQAERDGLAAQAEEMGGILRSLAATHRFTPLRFVTIRALATDTPTSEDSDD